MTAATEPRERGILFSDRLVRAILEGRKTQTRRIVKPQPGPEFRLWGAFGWDGYQLWTDHPHQGDKGNAEHRRCPYGVPGDRLYPGVEVPGFPGYVADTFGRIWSQASGEWKRLSNRRANSSRYATVTLARDGQYPTRGVHRLVCEAYYGPAPEALPEVRHLNGNVDDNAPENLDWGSRSDNMTDRAVHGTYSGEEHHAAVLTAKDVEAIRASTLPQRVLARRYGVSQSTVQAARIGDTWNALVEAPPPNLPRWASRIMLEITGVRVERVQEITHGDALDEGVLGAPGRDVDIDGDWYPSASRRVFAGLWNQTNGHRDGCTWADNPWCWVIEFRRVG